MVLVDFDTVIWVGFDSFRAMLLLGVVFVVLLDQAKSGYLLDFEGQWCK
ncbi:unnamed protein product [Acidithrix sp. C25]|nr:unnamed protein product [Acidithrix sp. C25]